MHADSPVGEIDGVYVWGVRFIKPPPPPSGAGHFLVRGAYFMPLPYRAAATGEGNK